MRVLSDPLRLLFCAAFFAAISCQGHGGENHSGEDLPGKDFKDGNLNNSQFDSANLKGANFGNATLKKSNFQKATLVDANFQSAVLDDADFTGADLKGADFADAKAWRAKFAGDLIELAGVNLVNYSKLGLGYRDEQRLNESQRLDCGKLSFHYADMHNCKIVGNAKGVDFRGADLRGADLSGTQNLDQAWLVGAKYDATTSWKIDPVKMRAELITAPDVAGQPTAAEQPAPTSPAPEALANHPLVGTWLILKGEKGATESGSLQIHPDGTYTWDYSASADVVKGKWEADGNKAVLKKGEKGQDWTANLAHADEILLKSDGGDERDAVISK